MGFQPNFIQGSHTLITGFAKLEHTPLPDVVSFFPPLGGNAGLIVFEFVPQQVPHFGVFYTSKRKQPNLKYESFSVVNNYEEKELCFRM